MKVNHGKHSNKDTSGKVKVQGFFFAQKNTLTFYGSRCDLGNWGEFHNFRRNKK